MTISVSSGTQSSPYRVLIIEDDRTQALFAQSVLHGAGMQAIVQMEAEGTMATIQQFKPDLILMDLHMPTMDGMRLTRMIRQQPEFSILPIVFLTGDPNPELQFEVLNIGADDFLNKPIRPRHLIAAVSNRILRARQQAQQVQHIQMPQPNENNSNTSAPDIRHHPETGLATRAHLLQMITEMLHQGQQGGLFFVEIANPLSLREHYGYATFEKLMNDVGRCIAELSKSQVLARLNDNSFLILAPQLEDSTQERYAKNIRDGIAQHPFTVRADETINLRSSIGFSSLSLGFSDTGNALEAVERSALQARLRPTGIAAYTPSPKDTPKEQFSLTNTTLDPGYQPIVAVAGNDQPQYQVLARLRQADGTLLSAAQVIPVVESTGAIVDLDLNILKHTLDILEKTANTPEPIRLFVSQAPRSLTRENFSAWLLGNLENKKIKGDLLVIDMRLTDALIHTMALQNFCSQLEGSGIKFCLSQFEPSLESDALLNLLPLNYLRLSARYAGAHASTEIREELRNTIEMAHNLNIKVIGQQIEDPQAAAAMWVGGVDYIQGNLIQAVGNTLNFDFHSAVL